MKTGKRERATAEATRAHEERLRTDPAYRRQDASRRAWDNRRAQAAARSATAQRVHVETAPIHVPKPKELVKSNVHAKDPHLAPKKPIGANVTEIKGERYGLHSPVIDDDHARKMFGTDIKGMENHFKTMVADVPGKFKVTYRRNSADTVNVRYRGEDGSVIERDFTKGADGKLTVEHSFFRLARTAQGSDAGKALFRNSLGVYKEMGVSKIKVHANIDIGGYAWGRYGFTPTPTGIAALNRSIAANVAGRARQGQIPRDVADHIQSIANKNTAESFHELMNSKYNGQSLAKPALLGSDWYGSINLRNPVELARTEAYVGHKD